MNPAEVEDIFDVLDSDHRALLESVTVASATEDAELLPSRCEQLVMSVVRHFVAEEQYLLPLIRHSLADGERSAKAAFEEHRTVEDELRRLEDVEHTPSTARPVLGDIEAGIRWHVTNQDDQLFPALRDRCDPARLHALAEEIIGSEQLAPTRPRVVRAESPALNKIVSLVAGYVDQIRDAYTHRGVRDLDIERPSPRDAPSP